MSEANDITGATATRDLQQRMNEATLFELLVKEQAKPQAFFAALRDSANAPSCNDERRAWVKELLLRAQEASLYEPPETP